MQVMTDNLAPAAGLLSPEWQSWAEDGLSRGCSVDSLIQVLVRDGRVSRPVAARAIAHINPHRANTHRRPFVQSGQNTVTTSDRIVRIALTVETPNIIVMHNVLSDEECDVLISLTKDKMHRSLTVAPSGGDSINVGRTSTGASLQRQENAAVAKIEARLAELVNWPVEKGEGLQCLRYGVGAEYKPHFDWFDNGVPGQAKLMERAGQRVATIVMYLNDVEAGGGTLFPELGLEVSPGKGSAVFFTNVTPEGQPDRLSLHGGSPVLSGEKFVATKWMREGIF